MKNVYITQFKYKDKIYVNAFAERELAVEFVVKIGEKGRKSGNVEDLSFILLGEIDALENKQEVAIAVETVFTKDPKMN